MASKGERSFDFSRVQKCRIHPGIGIARVGNSAAEFFIGPEVPRFPHSVSPPSGGYKDAGGRIKRQAARFRVYAYGVGEDGKEVSLGELPLAGRTDSRGAKVEWKVHLANRKAEAKKIGVPKAELRNPDVPQAERSQLVIDPGERRIAGQDSQSSRFDTACFFTTPVPLGELRTDEHGRLLVLGGSGRSGSVEPNNPIGNDPAARNPEHLRNDYWANNDRWYDDVSDGPVRARVELPTGRVFEIDDPKDAAWVIVAPPKFAPGVLPIITLYEVIREIAAGEGWPDDGSGPTQYFRDIYPILLRAADAAWVNADARRAHGYGKRGNFTPSLSSAKPPAHGKRALKLDAQLLFSERLSDPAGEAALRERIFAHLRNPEARGSERQEQADPYYMPALSGDGGDATIGNADTWLSLRPWQYRRFRDWKAGDFSTGVPEKYPDLHEMPPDRQIVALQRAALEPCVGGAFNPGIEMSDQAQDPKLYAAPFRVDSSSLRPGDITRHMALPWQADFADCRDNWWPAQRPDDVIPEDAFQDANSSWSHAEVLVSEGLEARVKWDRGLGVTTLFRRPWQNPAAALDDPRDTTRRRCDDMVLYWSELGFVVPRRAASGEIVQVETERTPFAGMDVRMLFFGLLNLDKHPDCLPKAREYVEKVLQAARDAQRGAAAFASMDFIAPFEYSEARFQQRMDDIYNDCVDFAMPGGEPFDPTGGPFSTPEAVQYRIRQLTPFNYLDGAWLRNVARVGPIDEVNSLLFSIFNEEMGEGNPAHNHPNVYKDLCAAFGYLPPPVDSINFALSADFLDAAFDSATFQLAISQLTASYYPEIIGMTLWLEWTAIDLHRIARMAENAKLPSLFYRMHIAIDNPVSGHANRALRAVVQYLQQIPGGAAARQREWQRIWDGYVAFSYTFAVLIAQVRYIVEHPSDPYDRLIAMIARKRAYGQYNHQTKTLGKTRINDMFAHPEEFLEALKREGYIVPYRADRSKFFALLQFEGPMYHVFDQDEIKLWYDWTEGGAKKRPPRPSDHPGGVAGFLLASDAALADAVPESKLALWSATVSEKRLGHWLHEASADRATDTSLRAARLDARHQAWLSWSMVRALLHLSVRHRGHPSPGTLAERLHRIRHASHPARAALALLADLAASKTQREKLVLVEGADAAIPQNDGATVTQTLAYWESAGCPVPALPERRATPLRLDSTIEEEEQHPTGLRIGFGTLH